jgi:hypothetical protein
MKRSIVAGAWLLVAALGCQLAPADVFAKSKADQEITLEHGFEGFNIVTYGPLVGDVLDVGTRSDKTNKATLRSIDMAAGKLRTLANDLETFTIIAADADRVAVLSDSPAGKIIVFNRADGGRTERCCSSAPAAAALFGDTLRLVDAGDQSSMIVALDLARDSQPQSVAVPRGLPVFWGDKLVLIDEAPADAPQNPSTLTA